jgi:hypothetical protein
LNEEAKAVAAAKESLVMRLFDHMNALTAGEPMEAVMNAVLEMLCVGVCVGAASKAEAANLASEAHTQ